ncbi:MAG: uracil-DNA glycosylase [Bdellovibrionaceae bacterium]|nr:uracil-DNA glycosylase [Pseudobdellovibrionaceae bacterium]
MENSVIEKNSNIKLDSSWLKHLEPEFRSPYMTELKSFLASEIKKKKVIYPKGTHYFEAMNRTHFDNVKVVILGQDPYHGEGQAHGLSFSVPKGVRPPPSLLNIFKEIKSDLGQEPSVKDDLSAWADQGVLLLNSVLTVEMGKAASHQGRGWEAFTDKIIDILNREKSGIVFILWGSYAQKKGAFIDRKKHLVIESPHPSPLSAHRGFLGSRPFSKANEYLKKQGKDLINW